LEAAEMVRVRDIKHGLDVEKQESAVHEGGAD
jgi:hypothetical protein